MKARKAPPWARYRAWRRDFPALVLLLLTILFLLRTLDKPSQRLEQPVHQSKQHPWHPIDDLIKEGEQLFHGRLADQSFDVSSAAAAYRKRRQRHPPPGFDKWFAFAQRHDAIIVEDFFDQIYDDIAPFWGLSPRWLARQARNFEHVVSVRRGRVSHRSERSKHGQWVKSWHKMVSGIAKYLPDVDMPVNVLDEPRILVPWDRMIAFMEAEKQSRRLQPADTISNEFSGLPKLPKERYDAQWTQNGPYWDLFRHACEPGSPAANTTAVHDFSDLPIVSQSFPSSSYHGYIHNWTLARSACHLPSLRNIHGNFIEPNVISTTQDLAPLFGGSKLRQNNEILIPPAIYWSKDSRYDPDGGTWADWLDLLSTRAERPWAQKFNRWSWRGVASGGRNHKENWTHFHRHRFVQMLNGSALRGVGYSASKRLETTEVPDSHSNVYNLTALRGQPAISVLGDWVSRYADVAFTHLACYPAWTRRATCAYSSPHFELRRQFSRRKTLASKYLPDLDGDSHSGRFLALLRSQSLPIKATVYSEWHDSRLIPWVHFVPLDNSLVDVYGVMEYFLGYEEPGRDDIAEKIAIQGREWAEKTLRGVDMQLYVWRVLLEFARVCDNERDRLGWVDDLLADKDRS